MERLASHGVSIATLFPANVNPDNGGKVPRALPYPQQETDANPNMKACQNLSENPVF